MLPDMELAETITPAQVLSLAEEVDVNPAVAIIEKFRRKGGDDTELAQAIRAVKLKEEAKKWAYAVISLVHNYVMLDTSIYVFYKDFVCSMCVWVGVCKVIIFFPHFCFIILFYNMLTLNILPSSFRMKRGQSSSGIDLHSAATQVMHNFTVLYDLFIALMYYVYLRPQLLEQDLLQTVC